GDDQARARAEDRLIRRRRRRLLVLLGAGDDAQACGQGGGGERTRQAHHQNLTLRLLRILRAWLIAFGCPNCGLPTIPFTPVETIRFSTLLASMRQAMLKSSPQRKVRPIAALSTNWLGPRPEFRPASPHCPAAGAA